MEQLQESFQKLLTPLGKQVEQVKRLRAHASDRQLFRLCCGTESFIGVLYENVSENRAFIEFSKHFRSKGLMVPEILAVADDLQMYIEQDLGDTTLYDCLLATRSDTDPFPKEIQSYYERALKDLTHFQVSGRLGIDFSLCMSGENFDAEGMRHDCLYFEQEFLKRRDVHYNATVLHAEFATLVEHLSKADADYFFYRDFQARNIMVAGEDLYYIDYQSGRRGPLQCDVASLLFQSQAKIPDSHREMLLEVYLQELETLIPVDRALFKECYYGFVVLRLMQVLGAYGKLGLGQQKAYFLEGIPSAVKNLQWVVAQHGLCVEAPCLLELVRGLGE